MFMGLQFFVCVYLCLAGNQLRICVSVSCVCRHPESRSPGDKTVLLISVY